MDTYKLIFNGILLKKAAALAFAVLVFANFSYINKENLKTAAESFKFSKSAVSQNAFNVSAHINKAANIISGLFGAKKSGTVTSADNNKKAGEDKNNGFLNYSVTPLAVSTVNSKLQNSAELSYLSGFNLFKMYIDPGGGGWRPDGLYPFMSYFLIMLLFFASSRKVFSNIFLYKTKNTGL
ncbi:MAG: hypothetical protein FWH43_00270 [Endomicrobia bacterium]|nr:hypothetical protein [Endomicrobiia bacterium]